MLWRGDNFVTLYLFFRYVFNCIFCLFVVLSLFRCQVKFLFITNTTLCWESQSKLLWKNDTGNLCLLACNLLQRLSRCICMTYFNHTSYSIFFIQAELWLMSLQTVQWSTMKNMLLRHMKYYVIYWSQLCSVQSLYYVSKVSLKVWSWLAIL